MRTKNFELDDRLRIVRRIGVMFKMRGVGGIYWAPQLAHHYRCQVRVRFNPDAIKKGGLNSVLIFSSDTGEYICEAWLMGLVDSKYGIEEVRRERRNFLSLASEQSGSPARRGRRAFVRRGSKK